MKTYSLDEVTDKFVGKKGTTNRENFESIANNFRRL